MLYPPVNTCVRPSSASFLVTFVLISRPLRYAAMLFKPNISPATVTVMLRSPVKPFNIYVAKNLLYIFIMHVCVLSIVYIYIERERDNHIKDMISTLRQML